MSNYASFTTTPVKSSFLKTGLKTTERKKSSKVFSSSIFSNSSFKTNSDQNESAESSLVVKLIENQISSEEQYQNLLIQNKELEIKVLALEQEAQRLRKEFKKANTPIEQLKAKIINAKGSLIDKQKYLQKYYLHLDSKLKSNKHSNLFGRLQKIQRALEKKYLQQKQDLISTLASQHSKAELASKQLQRLRQYRDQLIKLYTQRAIQVSSQRNLSEKPPLSIQAFSSKKSLKKSQRQPSEIKFSQKKPYEEPLKSSNQNKQQIQKQQKRQKQLAKQQYRKQCRFLRENIQKLKKQKQIVEKDEKLLKILLNIDEQHKKYSGYILNGYKKMFTIKYRHILLSRKRVSSKISEQKASQSIQSPNIKELQKQLNEKIAERKILEKQIQERNIGLEKCKQKLDEQISEYNALQQQVMKASNKNQGNKNKEFKINHTEVANNRSTYAGNLTLENHRSTYTSYQKHSEEFGDDL